MLRTDDAGRWTPDTGRWTLDAGPSTPYYKLTGELKIIIEILPKCTIIERNTFYSGNFTLCEIAYKTEFISQSNRTKQNQSFNHMNNIKI